MEGGLTKSKRRERIEMIWEDQQSTHEQEVSQVAVQASCQPSSLGVFQSYGDYISGGVPLAMGGTAEFLSKTAEGAEISGGGTETFMQGGYTGLLMEQIRTSQESSKYPLWIEHEKRHNAGSCAQEDIGELESSRYPCRNKQLTQDPLNQGGAAANMDKWNSMQYTQFIVQEQTGKSTQPSSLRTEACEPQEIDLQTLYEAPAGSLTHMLTAEDFDPRYDYSFESGLYITTSRCDEAAPSRSCEEDSTLNSSGQVATHGNEGQLCVNRGADIDDLKYLCQLNEKLLINHVQQESPSIETCNWDMDAQLAGDLQIDEATNYSEQDNLDGEQCISINEANLADVGTNTDLDTNSLDDDITEEDIEIFRQNENVEAAAMSLSQDGEDS
ncbi:unnamed protein product [Urochloa decumbens]|uniref:Uncharacterized protein n=1 Tax=Urochloa decumbens TaxID=240449 RepID=A0ABC8YH46_9POAL